MADRADLQDLLDGPDEELDFEPDEEAASPTAAVQRQKAPQAAKPARCAAARPAASLRSRRQHPYGLWKHHRRRTGSDYTHALQRHVAGRRLHARQHMSSSTCRHQAAIGMSGASSNGGPAMHWQLPATCWRRCGACSMRRWLVLHLSKGITAACMHLAAVSTRSQRHTLQQLLAGSASSTPAAALAAQAIERPTCCCVIQGIHTAPRSGCGRLSQGQGPHLVACFDGGRRRRRRRQPKARQCAGFPAGRAAERQRG